MRISVKAAWLVGAGLLYSGSRLLEIECQFLALAVLSHAGAAMADRSFM